MPTWRSGLHKRGVGGSFRQSHGVSGQSESNQGTHARMVFWWRHRPDAGVPTSIESKDIDIFLHDPQYLTMLSPKLNDTAESIASDYTEMSNFIKITTPEGE